MQNGDRKAAVFLRYLLQELFRFEGVVQKKAPAKRAPDV